MQLIATVGSTLGTIAAFHAVLSSFEAAQSFTRRVRVNNQVGQMFWTAHDTLWELFEGNNGAQLNLTRNRTNSFPDFHDLSGLLRTGLDNWFRMHNIW